MSVCLYPPSSMGTCNCVCHMSLGNVNCMICNCREHQDLTSLKARVKELERLVEEHGKMIRKEKLSPYKCPICEGSGHIGFDKNPYFPLTPEARKCKSCEGKGIIWG